ncbi:MAG: GGDEF domain-containing response regulator [Methyloligellaceae bacterium]
MHIALVDSSRVVVRIIRRMLEADGHTVAPFTDGRDAHLYISSEPRVDVLLTGLELASMCGLELCWQSRLLTRPNQPVYVIAMSSSEDGTRLVEALDCGADDFIRKPPVPEELYARLRAAERLASIQRELIRHATTDPLTGVYNRRAFFDRAETALAAAGEDVSVSAILFDIDHFKDVNDTYGHQIGDAVIAAVAKAAVFDGAFVGRLGGEEFALVLEGKDAQAAAMDAEQVRQRIEAQYVYTSVRNVSVTCSFGVSEWRTGDSLNTLIKRADLALYDAKRHGRNRVVVMSPEPCATIS